MNTRLLKGLTVQQKKELRQEVASSLFIPSIRKILQEELEQVNKDMLSIDNYDSANWQYLMSDYLSQQRTIRKIIDLLPSKEETNE